MKAGHQSMCPPGYVAFSKEPEVLKTQPKEWKIQSYLVRQMRACLFFVCSVS